MSFIKDNLEIAILMVVAVSVVPIVIEVLKSRREKRRHVDA